MKLQRVCDQALVLGSLCLATGRALAQQVNNNDDQNAAHGSNLAIFNPIENSQFWLTIATVLAGIVFFGGQLFLLRGIKNLTADDIVRNCSITIVIISATVLIVAGYNSQQTAQAFGLFGTIIGYLLGRSAGRRDPKSGSSAGGNADEDS
jgi:hypothetical protein